MAMDFFHFYRRYKWTSSDFDTFQTSILDSIRKTAKGSFGGAVLDGFEISPAGGLNLDVTAGEAVSPTGFLCVKTATEQKTVPVPTGTNVVSRHLLVVRPKVVDNTLITKPTDPNTQVYLKQTQDCELVIIEGTESATPDYPSKASEDVVLCGIRAAAGASSISLDDLDFDVREVPGYGSDLNKFASRYDDRLRPYRSSGKVMGIKPSREGGSAPKMFSYPGKGTPSLFPMNGSSEYNYADTFLNFETGVISGGDSQSSDFAASGATGSNSIVATVVLKNDDKLQVTYGTQGTRAQCLNAIKNQISTGAGAIDKQETMFKIAYVLVNFISGVISEIEAFDCRSFGGVSQSATAPLEYDNGNSGSSKNIDLSNGNFQKITLNASSPTLTFSNPKSGQLYFLKVYQDINGGRTAVWPLNIKWPSGSVVALTQTPLAEDIIMIMYDGTDYEAQPFLNIKKPQNYYGDGSDGDLSTSGNVTLTSSTDSDVIVKKYNNLTINSGHTLTVSNRCKGLVIYVKGNCVINGLIDMTGRGGSVDPVAAGVGANGLRFARIKAGQTDTLAASEVTGTGAALIAAELNQPGIFGNGKIYQIVRSASSGCGGKGGNAKFIGHPGGSGGGGVDGTCFSGGAGAGGAGYYGGPVAGSANGGAGGNGFTPTSTNGGGGGGAGNPGGSGGSGSGGGSSGSSGGTGTGGLIILIVKGTLTIGASGVIRSNGANGGAGGSGAAGYTTGGTGGGGSGGGIILILHGGTLSNSGTIQANGGSGGSGGYSPSSGTNEDPGYAGNTGTIIGPELIDP